MAAMMIKTGPAQVFSLMVMNVNQEAYSLVCCCEYDEIQREEKTQENYICNLKSGVFFFFHYRANALSLFKLIWVFYYPKRHDKYPLLPFQLVFPFSLRTYINPLFKALYIVPQHTSSIPTSTLVSFCCLKRSPCSPLVLLFISCLAFQTQAGVLIPLREDIQDHGFSISSKLQPRVHYQYQQSSIPQLILLIILSQTYSQTRMKAFYIFATPCKWPLAQ